MEQYQTLGKFYNAEQEISLAFDSTLVIIDTTNTEYADSLNAARKLYHLNNALSYISDINSTLQSVQYYQTINQLYLNYLSNDSLDESELQTTKDIAALCIYTYGSAVSLARTLSSLIDSTTTWNDATCYGNYRMNSTDDNDYLETLANVNTEKAKKKDKFGINDSFGLYPNPASNEINIVYKKMSSNSKIIIYNTIGVKLFEKLLLNENGKEAIDITKLVNGVYLYKIIDMNGNAIIQDKFTIVK